VKYLSILSVVFVSVGVNAAAIKASSFGYSETDSTKCLQSALNSGASTVIIDKQAGDWIIKPVKVRSNTEIIIEKDVVVRAKKNAFNSTGSCLFNIVRATNVTIRGEGNVRLYMEKSDYQNPKLYKRGEWRHLFNVRDSRNISISNLEAAASGGDGIYLARVHDVRLENLNCHDHHRQGISIIAARNLLVKNCSFDKTSGTGPSCGVDFEPNKPNEYFENIRFEKCTFSGNDTNGILFYLNHLNSESPPLSVAFIECVSEKNALMGLNFRGNPAEQLKGRIEFIRCVIRENAAGSRNISGESGIEIVFKDCKMDPDGKDYSKLRPVPKGTQSAPGEVNPVFIRSNFIFYQYFPVAGEYKIRFRTKPIHRKFKPCFRVKASGLGEMLLNEVELNGTNTEITVRTKHEDFVRFDITPVRSAVRVFSDYPGNGVLIFPRRGLFSSPGSRMWFAVPAGVENVVVNGGRGDPASVRLISPEGKVEASIERAKGAFKMVTKRKADAPLEIWMVEFPEMVEDCGVMVNPPCIPIFSATPEGVLAPTEK